MRVFKLILTRLAILVLVFSHSADFAHAQINSHTTIEPLTSEFDVSGFSNLFAGGMGNSPVVVTAAGQDIRVAWHKGPVPASAFGSHNERIVPFDFQNGIFVSTYGLDGTALDEPIRVDDPEAQGWPSHAIIAADATGRFVVVWRQSSWTIGKRIWMRPFDEEGNPLGDRTKLTEETDVFPSIDMAPNGEFVIVLGRTEAETADNFDKEPPRFMLFDENFQLRNDTPITIDETLDRQAYSLISAVSINENGDLAIAYVDSRIWSHYPTERLRLRTFSSEGLPISTPIKVDDREVSELAIEWLDYDQFVVSWKSGESSSIENGYWQVFRKDGQPVSERYHLENAVGQGGVFHLVNHDYATVWDTASGPVLILNTSDGQTEQIPFGTPGSAQDVKSPIKIAKISDTEFVGVMNNTVGRQKSVRAQVFSADSEGNPATFESEIVGPCIEDRTSTAKLTWSSDADYVEIYVVGPPKEKLFARGSGRGEVLTGQWGRQGMVFQLRDYRTGAVLATTTVSLNSDTCPISPVFIDPDPIEVCDPRERSSAEVLWDTTGLSSSGAEIRVNGVDGKLFALSGGLGTASTGNWLSNGMTFYLMKPHTTELLGTTTVSYQQIACD